MKLFLHILVTVITALMVFFFVSVVSNLPIGVIMMSTGNKSREFLENARIFVLVASLLCAVAMSIFVWGRFPLYMDKSSSSGFISSTFLSGIITASISAFVFFVGALIYDSTANLIPFAAFFMVAPIAFIVGCIGGGVRWYLKRRK